MTRQHETQNPIATINPQNTDRLTTLMLNELLLLKQIIQESKAFSIPASSEDSKTSELTGRTDTD
jgi:hypothetical protein